MFAVLACVACIIGAALAPVALSDDVTGAPAATVAQADAGTAVPATTTAPTATDAQSTSTSTTPDGTTTDDPSAPQIVVTVPDDGSSTGDGTDDAGQPDTPTSTSTTKGGSHHATRPAAPSPTPNAVVAPVPPPQLLPPAPPAPTAPRAAAKKHSRPHHVAAPKAAPAPAPVAATPAPAPRAAAKKPGPARFDRNHPYRNLKPYVPAEHKGQMLAITAGGAAMIAALGAGLGAGAGGAGRTRGGGSGGRGGGGGGGGGEDGGWLEDVELEREGRFRMGHGRGDVSRTWRWPWTDGTDNFSKSWPNRLAQVSPVLGRVSIDGDYLRAILGSLYLLLAPLAIALGIIAAGSAHYVSLPPTFGLFVAILALSVFDSMMGYLAAIAFGVTILLHGGIHGGGGIRELAGITLLWFAMPLSAAAMRPLRRNLDLKVTGLWDRSADLVLAGLFAAWIASNQVSALGPLLGYETPIDSKRWTIALLVLGFVAIRVLVETAAAHFYPKRLASVEHEGELEPPRVQEAISLAIQILVLMYISSSFLGWTWALFLGTAIFFTPLVPWLFVEKLPKSRLIAKWMPAGLAKWTWIIIASILLSKLLDHLITNPTKAIEWGFILLPLPVLLVWGLELFAAEDEDESDSAAEEEEGRFPMTWPLRLAGVPITAVCVYLVYFVIG